MHIYTARFHFIMPYIPTTYKNQCDFTNLTKPILELLKLIISNILQFQIMKN